MKHQSLVFRFALIVPLIGCGKVPEGANQAQKEIENVNVRPHNIPVQAKPDYSLSAKRFAQEYDTDKEAHKAKYRGKVIELTGKVKTFSNKGRGETQLLLHGIEGAFRWVQCVMTDDDAWKKALPGQTVRLDGAWPEFSLGPALMNCQILEITGEKPHAYTADEFASEYSIDASAMRKENENKYLLLTGEVAEIEQKELGALVTLQTKVRPPRVLCFFSALDRNDFSAFKRGQRLQVLGEFDLNLSKDEVRLHSCVQLAP